MSGPGKALVNCRHSACNEEAQSARSKACYAAAPDIMKFRKQRGAGDADADEDDQDRADGVDLRLHPEANLRIDADRQRGRAGSRGEARDDEIVERQSEGK